LPDKVEVRGFRFKRWFSDLLDKLGEMKWKPKGYRLGSVGHVEKRLLRRGQLLVPSLCWGEGAMDTQWCMGEKI